MVTNVHVKADIAVFSAATASPNLLVFPSWAFSLTVSAPPPLTIRFSTDKFYRLWDELRAATEALLAKPMDAQQVPRAK